MAVGTVGKIIVLDITDGTTFHGNGHVGRYVLCRPYIGKDQIGNRTRMNGDIIVIFRSQITKGKIGNSGRAYTIADNKIACSGRGAAAQIDKSEVPPVQSDRRVLFGGRGKINADGSVRSKKGEISSENIIIITQHESGFFSGICLNGYVVKHGIAVVCQVKHAARGC